MTDPTDRPLPAVEIERHGFSHRCIVVVRDEHGGSREMTLSDLCAVVRELDDESADIVARGERKRGREQFAAMLHNAMPPGFVELDPDKIIGRVAERVRRLESELAEERARRERAEAELAVTKQDRSSTADWGHRWMMHYDALSKACAPFAEAWRSERYGRGVSARDWKKLADALALENGASREPAAPIEEAKCDDADPIRVGPSYCPTCGGAIDIGECETCATRAHERRVEEIRRQQAPSEGAKCPRCGGTGNTLDACGSCLSRCTLCQGAGRAPGGKGE